MNIQNSNTIFVFDMDNTLIKTDRANNLAYSEAICSVLGVQYRIDSTERFTRNKLKNVFPSLSDSQIYDIIAHKEKCFVSYLPETELNNNLFKHLQRLFHKGYHTILLTNCHSERAISLCDFYNLTKYFVQCFFYEDCLGRKYELLKSLGYNLKNMVLYENDVEATAEAIKSGVNMESIIKINF